jgi:anti-anti-sigma factor
MTDLVFKQANDWLLVRFTNSSLTEPMMLERMRNALTNRLRELQKGSKVCISFKGVEYVSSQIIGLMLSAKDEVANKMKGTFALARVGPNVMDVLRLTKLDRQFKIGETETDIVGKRPKTKFTKFVEKDPELDWLD